MKSCRDDALTLTISIKEKDSDEIFQKLLHFKLSCEQAQLIRSSCIIPCQPISWMQINRCHLLSSEGSVKSSTSRWSHERCLLLRIARCCRYQHLLMRPWAPISCFYCRDSHCVCALLGMIDNAKNIFLPTCAKNATNFFVIL